MLLTPLLLGLLMGGAVYAGLSAAFSPGMNERRRSFFTSVSTGSIIYLFVEICAKMIDELEDLLGSAMADYPTWRDFSFYSFLFLAALSAGLLGLVYFEEHFIRRGQDELLPVQRARRMALFSAIGSGLQCLVGGLAIGAEYSWGENALAALIALGFGFYNATNGFTIASPLSGRPPEKGFFFSLGSLGVLAALLGVLIGGLKTSKPVEFFILALAAGTILYSIGELLHVGRRLKEEAVVGVGLLVGFIVAFALKMILVSQSGQL